jgi:hypothetical protein
MCMWCSKFVVLTVGPRPRSTQIHSNFVWQPTTQVGLSIVAKAVEVIAARQLALEFTSSNARAGVGEGNLRLGRYLSPRRCSLCPRHGLAHCVFLSHCRRFKIGPDRISFQRAGKTKFINFFVNCSCGACRGCNHCQMSRSWKSEVTWAVDPNRLAQHE